MPKIDIATVLTRKGSGYPSPFDAMMTMGKIDIAAIEAARRG